MSDELSLHVFEQETTGGCSSLTRRYLSYVPSYEEDWVLDRWGFRNQDVDASIAVWEFLMQP